MEIILNSEGVAFKGEMMKHNTIYWNNLVIDEKADGSINLHDRTVSIFNRKLNGTGSIKIPPEIENREALVNALASHS